MYMQRTTSGAAGNGLYITIRYMRGASGIGMGTTIKHLRRTTSGAAGNGLGATMKYLRRTTSAAANNGMSTTITPPCRAASFEVNSEPHTGARSSVRLCVGSELARCVHKNRCDYLRRQVASPFGEGVKHKNKHKKREQSMTGAIGDATRTFHDELLAALAHSLRGAGIKFKAAGAQTALASISFRTLCTPSWEPTKRR